MRCISHVDLGLSLSTGVTGDGVLGEAADMLELPSE